MPNALVKSIASRAGVKKSKVEKSWKKLEAEYGTNYKAIVGTLEKIYDCGNKLVDTNRELTDFHHLKIDDCVLTAESVDDYLGKELPATDGIDPDKIYKIYRPGTELKKALNTYNMVPLTNEHHFVDGQTTNKDKWLGGVGDNAYFKDGKVYNSVAVWDKNEVSTQTGLDFTKKTQNSVGHNIYELKNTGGTMSGKAYDKRDGLSCGYSFKLVTEAGVWNGQPYDFKMVDLVCNHVALVKKPRVEVAKLADSLHNILKGKNNMDAIALIQRLTRSHPQLIADTSEAMEKEKEAILDKKKKGKDKKGKDGYKESTSSATSSTDEDPDDMEDSEPDEAEDNEPEQMSMKDKKSKRRNLNFKDMKKGKDADGETCAKPMTGDDISALVKKHLVDYNIAKDVCERAIGKTTFAADAAPEDMYNRTLKALKVACDGLDLSAKVALVKYIGDNKTTVTEKQRPVIKDSAADTFQVIEI